jgi:hypothetical protein
MVFCGATQATRGADVVAKAGKEQCTYTWWQHGRRNGSVSRLGPWQSCSSVTAYFHPNSTP